MTHAVTSDGVIYYVDNSSLYSVYPPTSFLTFGPWIYMVPPFKPASVLILGYAGGTVAGLIRQLYGSDVTITGVDLHVLDNRYDVGLIQADAREFVQSCGEYECVIVDIFNQEKTPEFVCEMEFVDQIARITTDFLIVHSDDGGNIGIYEQHFRLLRVLNVNHQKTSYLSKHSKRSYFPPQ